VNEAEAKAILDSQEIIELSDERFKLACFKTGKRRSDRLAR